VPIASWLRGELRDFARDHLLSSTFASRGLFRPDTVADLVNRHQSGAADYSHHLWILLMFDMWAREIDEARRQHVPLPAAGAGLVLVACLLGSTRRGRSARRHRAGVRGGDPAWLRPENASEGSC